MTPDIDKEMAHNTLLILRTSTRKVAHREPCLENSCAIFETEPNLHMFFMDLFYDRWLQNAVFENIIFAYILLLKEVNLLANVWSSQVLMQI